MLTLSMFCTFGRCADAVVCSFMLRSQDRRAVDCCDSRVCVSWCASCSLMTRDHGTDELASEEGLLGWARA